MTSGAGIGEPPEWRRIDTAVVSAAVLAAAVTRLWRIAAIPAPIYDERLTLDLARSYLSGNPALFVHPPLEALLVSASITALGDQALSWRLPNAALGTALMGITYMLGRRMFGSRLAAAFAAAIILLDGMFLVSSRIATKTAAETTFIAWSYLLAWRAAQVRDRCAHRWTLVALAITLGLALATKLVIPLVTCMLVAGLIGGCAIRIDDQASRLAGTFAILLGVAGITYLAVFIPNWRLGWWLGIGDFVRYHVWAAQTHLALPPDHSQASPWWSWPLMLRPFAYWIFPTTPPEPAGVATVWCSGNPALWWAALAALAILAARIISRPAPSSAFILLGYAAYLAMWLPVRRYVFIYDYAPPLYLAYLALAAFLAELWSGTTRPWEQILMLATLTPTLLLGLGAKHGTPAAVALAVAYTAAFLGGKAAWAGRFVFLAILAATLVLFIYFLPLWIPWMLTPAQYSMRMWLNRPGLLDWR